MIVDGLVFSGFLLRTVFIKLFIVFFLSACTSAPTVEYLRQSDVFVGDLAVRVELAITAEERRLGLMFRSELNQNEGMLFIFPETRIQSFWMKNTFLPLDLGYFDENGVLIEIFTMLPDDGVAVYPSTQPVRYALEMSMGWFSAEGIRLGVVLTLPIL